MKMLAKEILNMLDIWLEMSILGNFNNLVGILLGPADFFVIWWRYDILHFDFICGA